ncbi:Putative sensory transducer protein YfmS [Sporomusa rhizae]|uniref:methyl-accepting chemotaxis protein n=1 Tax=Sporomusa rhizae TaxID=357999 RepID=UPI00352BACDA
MTDFTRITNSPAILTYFEQVFPYLANLSTGEVGVSLTDRDKYLLYQPSRSLHLKINKGDSIKQGSAVYRAIHEQKRIMVHVDKTLFGQPYIAVAVPLYDDRHQIVGAVCIQEPVERQESLKEMATQLSSSITILAGATQDISAQTQELSAVSRTLTQLSHESETKVSETDQILGLVKNITGQTNLLGLNASIEAARVGEQGRGFSVVAEEIRKLAASSTDSIKKIDAIIKAIQVYSHNSKSQIEHIGNALTQVAESISSIAGTAQQISSMAQQLDQMADSLYKDAESFK